MEDDGGKVKRQKYHFPEALEGESAGGMPVIKISI
jgi:hypothetical protein